MRPRTSPRASDRSKARAFCFRRQTSRFPARRRASRAGGNRRRRRCLPHRPDRAGVAWDPADCGSRDAIVLASGSAARSLAAVAGRSTASAASTSSSVSAPRPRPSAREVGLPVGLVADESTGDGIIRALVSHFAESTDVFAETRPLDALGLAPGAPRPRRLRRTQALRDLVRETTLGPMTSSSRSSSSPETACVGPFRRCRGSTSSRATARRRRPRSSLRSVSRPCCSSESRRTKDALGLESFAEDGVVQQAIRSAEGREPGARRHHRRLPLRVHGSRPLRCAGRARLPAERRDARALGPHRRLPW